MSWQERFQKIRDLADKKEAGERERIREEQKRIKSLRKERRKTVKSIAPRIEKVCKQFNRGVKGKMTKYKKDEWGINFGWNVQTSFGGVRVRSWPWLRDSNKSLPLRGIWLQYLGPRGSSTIDTRRARGTKLNTGENPMPSGYYYWHQPNNNSLCTCGYFLSLDISTEEKLEEKLAKILEKIGHDLLRFTAEDFPEVPADAMKAGP